MKIVSLTIENVKRIVAAHIQPSGPVTVLSGKNGAGKSSVLDAIQMALGGQESIPPMPLRQGSKKGSVQLDLEEVLLTRTFTEAGGGTLKIEAKIDEKTRAAIKSPQAWLNERIGKLSFDPLAFMRETGKVQGETLRRLVGLDTSELDNRRKALYDDRTILNRQIRDAEGSLANMPAYPDAPADPLSAEAIQAELNEAKKVNQAADELARRVPALATQASKAENSVTDAGFKVTRLENELRAAKEAEERARLAAEAAQKAHLEAVQASETAPRVDESPIIQRLTDVGAVNARVQANQAKALADAKLELQGGQSESLTRQIEEVDSTKAQLLVSAPFPVEGLSFDEAGGVTYRGLPMSQASGAEQIRVSMAVALAMNPKLKLILIRDASLLDTESMAIIADLAEKAEAQCWLERVEDGDPGAIVIEDGAIRGALVDGHETKEQIEARIQKCREDFYAN